jgi:hypothetical protein
MAGWVLVTRWPPRQAPDREEYTVAVGATGGRGRPPRGDAERAEEPDPRRDRG